MTIQDYYQLAGDQLQFSEIQASEFAKSVAGDFNPLHDVGGKRFCVPGDLLFSVLLDQYGIYTNMQVKFDGMLSAGVPVTLPAALDGALTLSDAKERNYLHLSVSGDRNTDKDVIARLTREYVQFSGKTFPDILVELMRREGVMINAARPLVIYSDMALELTTAAITSPELRLANTSLTSEGKKGHARLQFDLFDDGGPIGRGEKNMVLGGLREYDEEAMSAIVEQYRQWQHEYASAIARSTLHM